MRRIIAELLADLAAAKDTLDVNIAAGVALEKLQDVKSVSSTKTTN